jgi:hypothetical protein
MPGLGRNGAPLKFGDPISKVWGGLGGIGKAPADFYNSFNYNFRIISAQPLYNGARNFPADVGRLGGAAMEGLEGLMLRGTMDGGGQR